ncbi:hypothetical protein AB834_04345 [PVC group bacterium (ex Bugula neritina AB1)]|nr:hypothetical protein AB834_04345 [PVC group bacterium (ex Bugula neritina AB1)]
MSFKFVYLLGSFFIKKCENLGRFFLFVFQVFSVFFQGLPRYSLILKQIYVIAVLSLPVVLITGAFTGMVITIQSYAQLHMFSLEVAIPPIVGLAMTRELGPVLTALMLAGRAGAAITAEIGTMRVTEQIDALVSLATNPLRYLVLPRVLACVLFIPILTIFSIFIGILSGYLLSVYGLGFPRIFFISNIQQYVEVYDILSGLTKTFVFGLIIGLVSCYKGFFTKKGAEGVGVAVMQTVVLASISILIADFFLSLMLF